MRRMYKKAPEAHTFGANSSAGKCASDRQKKKEAAPYSTTSCSTIGAGELNGRVRNGNGCGLPARAASKGVGGWKTEGKMEEEAWRRAVPARIGKTKGPLVPLG